MLAARLRPNAMLGMMGARAMSTEIPINSVARIVRCVLFCSSSAPAAPAAFTRAPWARSSAPAMRLRQPSRALRGPDARRSHSPRPSSRPPVRSSHVADEEAAMKLDEMVSEAKGTLEAANLPGYVKTVRTVCKAEWGARSAICSPPRPCATA